VKRRTTIRMPSKALSAATAAWLYLAPPAWSQQTLRPTLAIEAVRIQVTWVDSRAELEAKRREYGTPRPAAGVVRETLEAFSVLGRRNGELVCLIFAPKPARFDDRVNTSLGHELLHCFGFNHEG
jgi:hypothetical protein